MRTTLSFGRKMTLRCSRSMTQRSLVVHQGFTNPADAQVRQASPKRERAATATLPQGSIGGVIDASGIRSDGEHPFLTLRRVVRMAPCTVDARRSRNEGWGTPAPVRANFSRAMKSARSSDHNTDLAPSDVALGRVP